MKLLERYLIKNFLPAFIWCLFSFIFLYWIIDLFGHLDEILRYKVPIKIIAQYYLCMTPQIFIQITPVATLLASIYSLSNLSRHNEIVAMHSCGVSLFRIALPLLMIGFLISTFTLIINDRLVPATLQKAQSIKVTRLEKNQLKKIDRLDNLTMYGSKNRLYYARSYDVKAAKLNDLVIIEHDRNLNPVKKITAELAVWEYQNWKLYNCIIYQLGVQGEVRGTPKSYLEKTLDINETPQDFLAYRSSSELMNFRTLYNYIRNFGSASTKITRKLLVDLYTKISFPLINFIMVWIAIPFSITTSRSGGTLRAVTFSLGIALLYYAIIAISVTLGKEGMLTPFWGAWLANVLFGGMGLVLLIRLRR